MTRRLLRTEVCVIGSGAGGAPVAKELAAAGVRVALLEEGPWHDPATFDRRPRDMALALYRDGGQLATLGDPPVVVPLGRGIGGTTLVNSGTCFRTPEAVLARWRDELGLDWDLEDCFARVERTIGVAEVPEALAGRNALLVRDGAARLGLSGGFLRRNATGCRGSGVCAFGCPTGAKRHVGASYVEPARAAGATIVTGARVTRVVAHGAGPHEVRARMADGGRLRVLAERVVVACGTLLTPALLRRSGLGGASGQLGRNLSLHPASAARARFDEVVDQWRGVPQSYYVDELAGDGIMLEGIAGPPDQAAMSTPLSGAAHREWMLDARRTASFGVMVCDSARGSVREMPTRPARPLVRYDLHAEDARRFQRGFALLADIWWAAGAREIAVPLAGVPVLRDGDSSPLTRARVRPRDVAAMAFHPLGTARAGADPATSVVGPDLALHGVEGVYVADGSVVPAPPGVNPQVTIMALATRLAFALLGRACPASYEPLIA
ncbi:MAG TPA: GMC family oxidoreductase [Solirubrobacteraceae bacterium]|nr:GMC family oxidoreductase [Solirubrobacteraceae bacterium]